MTDIRPLTGRTAVAMLDLDVAPDQSHLVAPNAVTLAQAHFEHGSDLFGLFDGETPVGLLAVVDMAHPQADLDDGDPRDGLYLWRLMVDARHQGHGHGRAALRFAADLAQERGRRVVQLSVVPGDGTAMGFYEAEGYTPTGRIIDDEIELSKRVTPS